jgi:hypothetical protein
VFEEVYADATMDRACPNCQAPPNGWCKRPSGEIRPIPCVARLRATAPPDPPDVEAARASRSFSEPIHQPEAEQ